MTNYNDGKWHGWNGGVRPIHPLTEIEVVMWSTEEGGKVAIAGEAKDFDWSASVNPIVVFRVVKEYKEPREVWANEYPGYLGKFFNTKEDAQRNKGEGFIRVVKFREVIE